MSCKILINGRNSVLAGDIIRYTSENSICFSTSDLWADILVHIKLMQPDAYVIFYPKDDDKDQMITQIQKLMEYDACKEMAYVVVADPEELEELEKKAPFLEILKIARPTSAQDIEKRTRAYISAQEKKRLQEAKKRMEEERAALAREEEKKALEEQKKKKKEEEKARIKKAKEESLAALASNTPKAASGKKSKSGSASETEGANARKHILIVDDDRNVLKLLKATLSDKYDVTAMLNGKMAEKYLETKTADLILLDHEMPVESGLEVFQKIKEDKKQSKVPVIFLTGTSDAAKIKEILALHPKGYLLKPVDVDKLITTIADALK